MEIKSRMPGKVMDYKVNVGDIVKKGDIVAVMEAMKMKNPIPSPVDGTVKEIRANLNERINPGNIIMIIE